MTRTASSLSGSRRLRAWLLVLFVFSSLASQSFGWWKSDWTIRRKVTIDTSSSGTSITDPIGATEVLLRLHDGTLNFAAAKDDGGDLRFVAEDDKTVLPYHIEQFDNVLNEAFVWVRLPEVKPGAKTSFFIYYGNGTSSATRADDAKGTYDGDTVIVYHFGEHNASPTDQTGKGNNGQTPLQSALGALIGGGAKFDGKKPIKIGASSTVAWGQGSPLTWSAWIKPAVITDKEIVFARRGDAGALVIGLDKGAPFVEVGGQHGAAPAPLAAGGWHHLAVVSNAGKVTLYVDGETSATLNADLPSLNTDMALGGDTQEGAVNFSGEMDEFHLAKAVRAPGFIRFAVGNQTGDTAAKMMVYGEDEQTSSWFSGGTLGVIMKSLTVDGWVVIGILVLMSIISWFVMVSKVRALNAISRSNEVFLTEWHRLASDLTVLDEGDAEQAKSLGGKVSKPIQRALRSSPLYRIYHVGVEEIRHRIAGRPPEERVLSGLSMQAIRSSMDAGLVREQQSLSKAIVMLTLSISGGPFIGLLGTVVGVMITFAAIAAAGDVNVNAIAPGIAAALAATVAGMGVAIPALFGYNYILSRVKDATSDMHVFIDEFVTKAAEFYSPVSLSGRVRAATDSPRREDEFELAGSGGH